MALTTTAINACDVAIWLDDDAAAPQDISGSSNEIDLNFDNKIGEFFAFGSQWPARIECGKDASFSLKVIYTTAADEGFDILKQWYFATSPGNRTLSVYVPDKNVGSDRFQGEMKIENLSWTLTGGSADPIIATASLLPDGAVTHSTTAT